MAKAQMLMISNGISIEENGRIVGSFFAHKTIDTITSNFTQNPSFANELKNFEFNPTHSFPNWIQSNPEISISEPHSLADLAFSTKIQCYIEQRDVLQAILNERLN